MGTSVIIEAAEPADLHKLCGDTSDTSGDFSDAPVSGVNTLPDLSRGLE